MESVSAKNFGAETVTVDGKSFIGCTFDHTTLVYGAGEVPQFANCEFENVMLEFTDEAKNTLKFLSAFYNGGFTRSVETVFSTIRQQNSSAGD